MIFLFPREPRFLKSHPWAQDPRPCLKGPVAAVGTATGPNAGAGAGAGAGPTAAGAPNSGAANTAAGAGAGAGAGGGGTNMPPASSSARRLQTRAVVVWAAAAVGVSGSRRTREGSIRLALPTPKLLLRNAKKVEAPAHTPSLVAGHLP